MKVLIYDLDESYVGGLQGKYDALIHADGAYAPCRGCFQCWTKHPAKCVMRDVLQQVSRVVGKADELTIVTENCYGSHSADVKAVLDRSIGLSTPLFTWRGTLMHHTLRYGKHRLLRILVYGDVTEWERETFLLTGKRNALNLGYERSEVIFLENPSDLEEVL